MMRSPDTDGFALVWVLGCLIVVAVAITPFTIFARTQLKIAANVEQAFRYDLLADGLATLALIQNRKTAATLGVPASHETWCRLDDHLVHVHLQDHAGLIDLNRSSLPLIAAGVRSMGFDDRQSLDIAAKIVRYRRPAPGEAPSAQVKRAPYEAVIELKEIDELSNLATDLLTSRFSVYSDQSRVSLALAPHGLEKAIGESVIDDNSVEQGGGLSTGILTVTIALSSMDGAFLGFSEKTVSTGENRLRLLERRARPDRNAMPPPADTSHLSACGAILGISTLDELGFRT